MGIPQSIVSEFLDKLSIIALDYMTEYFWEFLPKLHCGYAVAMPYCDGSGNGLL